MEVHALWAEDGASAWFEDRGGRFEEEEGFRGADIVELSDVVSFGVSAGGPLSQPWAQTAESGWGEMEGGEEHTHNSYRCRRLCGSLPRHHERPL